jgi:hypothetical protein
VRNTLITELLCRRPMQDDFNCCIHKTAVRQIYIRWKSSVIKVDFIWRYPQYNQFYSKVSLIGFWFKSPIYSRIKCHQNVLKMTYQSEGVDVKEIAHHQLKLLIYTLYSTHQNFDVSINVATELFYSTTSCTGRIKRHAAFNQNCRI